MTLVKISDFKFYAMKLLFNRFILLLLAFCFDNSLSAQQENSNNVLMPPAEWTVQSHKEGLKLTLIIDSVQIGNKVERLKFQRILDINYESDYLQIKGDIYIKIFIARNQEYGKKFYSWRWDYLKKIGDKYSRLNIGYYAPMDFNQSIPTNGDYGQGTGDEGQSDYLMFHYRYKLE